MNAETTDAKTKQHDTQHILSILRRPRPGSLLDLPTLTTHVLVDARFYSPQGSWVAGTHCRAAPGRVFAFSFIFYYNERGIWFARCTACYIYTQSLLTRLGLSLFYHFKHLGQFSVPSVNSHHSVSSQMWNPTAGSPQLEQPALEPSTEQVAARVYVGYTQA